MKNISQKTATDDVDRDILSLFPSLDFNRTKVHNQTKKRMKKYLIILKKAAEMEYVTKYILTKEGASPRMGGQVAQKALEELEELGLLMSKQATSKKGTPRIDRILTPKGIIACMAINEFQKVDKLRQILKRPCYKGSKLALILEMYNAGLVRREGIEGSQTSPAVVIVKELAIVHRFNLDRKSEDDIAKDFRSIEEAGFFESLKITPIEAAITFLQGSKNEEFRYWMNEASKLNLNSEVLDIMTKLNQNILLFFTSPEARIWMMSVKSNITSYEELKDIMDKKNLKSKFEFKDDLEIAEMYEDILKHMKESIISLLIKKRQRVSVKE